MLKAGFSLLTSCVADSITFLIKGVLEDNLNFTSVISSFLKLLITSRKSLLDSTSLSIPPQFGGCAPDTCTIVCNVSFSYESAISCRVNSPTEIFRETKYVSRLGIKASPVGVSTLK